MTTSDSMGSLVLPDVSLIWLLLFSPLGLLRSPFALAHKSSPQCEAGDVISVFMMEKLSLRELWRLALNKDLDLGLLTF